MLLIEIIIAIILSIIITYLVRLFAIKKSIIDTPNERSSHSNPTPRGGGLAIVIVWLSAISYLYLKNEIEDKLFYALLSVLPLVIIGLLDDVFSLSPKLRILFQIITVGLGLYFLGGVTTFNIGFYSASNLYVLTLLFFIGALWFINLYNFLDGIDAYASVQAIFMALAIFLFTHNNILLFLIAAICGFLFWNWPKAKIFMGDVGSTTLGYTLYILGIYFNNIGEFNIINWLIISALFWFDATLTLLRRFKNKEKLSVAHKKHAYQRIVQFGYSHQKTVLISIVINIFLLGLIYLSTLYSKYILLFLFFALVLMYVIVKLIDNKNPFIYKK